MSKEKITTYIQLYSGEVELNISVTNKLKKQKGALNKFGYIQVSNGMIDSKDCFWDNLQFFIDYGFGIFKEECAKELKEKGFKVKQTYKDIKRLLKQAEKLNIL